MAASSSSSPSASDFRARFQIWMRDHEINREVGLRLLSVLLRVKVVMVVDDSGSMASRIVEGPLPGRHFWDAPVYPPKPPPGSPPVTRWTEAQQACALLVRLLTSASNNGLDVWFLNRAPVRNVTEMGQLAASFSSGPTGGTPLISTFNAIFATYRPFVERGIHVLILSVGDGEPSDGTIQTLAYCWQTKHKYFHISFIECNDNEREMEFMDSLDGQIHNFHNTYVIRALLEPFASPFSWDSSNSISQFQ